MQSYTVDVRENQMAFRLFLNIYSHSESLKVVQPSTEKAKMNIPLTSIKKFRIGSQYQPIAQRPGHFL